VVTVSSARGTAIAFFEATSPVHDVKASLIMDLSIWIPAMVILGLVTMGLMFAFLEACEKV
jgi:hypothetical protein